jgi:hypothetical protein
MTENMKPRTMKPREMLGMSIMYHAFWLLVVGLVAVAYGWETALAAAVTSLYAWMGAGQLIAWVAERKKEIEAQKKPDASSDALVEFHGAMQEELFHIGLSPTIADDLAQPLFQRMVKKASNA